MLIKQMKELERPSFAHPEKDVKWKHISREMKLRTAKRESEESIVLIIMWRVKPHIGKGLYFIHVSGWR